MSEKQGKDEILELIRLVDSNKSKLFKWYDVFSGSWFLLFIIVVTYIVIVPSLLSKGTPDIDKFVLGFSFVAVVLACFSLIAHFIEENRIEVNFKRIVKLSRDEGNKLEENKKPLLKALIKIKSKNEEFSLEQIYNIYPSMFKREKLLERLYEQRS